MESLQLGNGDKDNNGLLAALDVDLTGRGDLEGSKLGLELRNVVLEVQESLGNLLLNLGGGSARSVGSAVRLARIKQCGRDVGCSFCALRPTLYTRAAMALWGRPKDDLRRSPTNIPTGSVFNLGPERPVRSKRIASSNPTSRFLILTGRSSTGTTSFFSGEMLAVVFENLKVLRRRVGW